MSEITPAATPPTNEPEIKPLPVEHLRHDPHNPRIPPHVRDMGDAAVFQWMLNKANILELMGSISQTGYFPGEPLLVAKTDHPEMFDVVEGNRRLTAVQLLRNPELAPVKRRAVQMVAQSAAKPAPENLPCVIYSSRDDILSYLGYRHITGVQEWSALEKARYLSQLVGGMVDLPQDERYRAAARIIGSRSDYVKRLLTGLRVFQEIERSDFFEIPDLDAESLEFSVLTTALSYANLADFVGLREGWDPEANELDVDRLRRLTEWAFKKLPSGKTKLGESRRLRELNEIVIHPAALEAFEAGRPILEAARLAGQPLAVFRNATYDAHSRLKEARYNLEHVEKTEANDLELVSAVATEAESLRSAVTEKLEA